MTPPEPTAQDAAGSTIASADDLRVVLFFNADEPTRSFDHVSERHRWPARTTHAADSRARSGSAMEMPAPWTAQNAAHRALEISRPPARFPHSHSRLLFLDQERRKHGKNTTRIRTRQQSRPVTGQRQLPGSAAVASGLLCQPFAGRNSCR